MDRVVDFMDTARDQLAEGNHTVLLDQLPHVRLEFLDPAFPSRGQLFGNIPPNFDDPQDFA